VCNEDEYKINDSINRDILSLKLNASKIRNGKGDCYIQESDLFSLKCGFNLHVVHMHLLVVAKGGNKLEGISCLSRDFRRASPFNLEVT
jgi:hypothetical protein